jgi:hypothetical protein
VQCARCCSIAIGSPTAKLICAAPYQLSPLCIPLCACRLQEEGLSMLGAFPEDAMLRTYYQ